MANPKQLDLFGRSPVTAETPSWANRHWPEYSSSGSGSVRPERPSPASSALVLWAETITDLPPGARMMLCTLAGEAKADASCRMCLPSLAQAAGGMARNTVKRHLERLMKAELVMMKPWTVPTGRKAQVLGYEFRLIVDHEDRTEALSNGFSAHRAVRE